MAKRSAGRPSVYGFDKIEPGATWEWSGEKILLERMRRAALAHARNFDKLFKTECSKGKITITRVE